MKDITMFLTEMLNEGKIEELEKKLDKVEKKAEDAEKEAKKAEEEANKAEESIKDEKSFREYAEAKLKEVHGDEYDEAKAKETINGILEDNKELVEKGDWGALIGILNNGVVK